MIFSEAVNYIKRSIDWLEKTKSPWPEHEEGLRVRTYRDMVGGNWEMLGELQFSFMINYAGLKPEDVLLDLGCGSLRGGRLFIPFLNERNYLGMDKQEVLINAGRKNEVPPDIWEEKKPEIIVSSTFEVEKFSRRPKFVLAQSLFTHLLPKDIKKCLKKLKPFIQSNGLIYASFCEIEKPIFYTRSSHSSRDFYYTFKQMENFANKTGWQCSYIGDWNHPHPHTKMLKYTLK